VGRSRIGQSGLRRGKAPVGAFAHTGTMPGVLTTSPGLIEVPAVLSPRTQPLAGTDLRRLRPPLFLASVRSSQTAH